VNFAFGTGSFFTLNLTFWTFADWMTFGWTSWVIALPSAFRVAFVFCVSVNLHFVGNHGHDHEGEDEEYFAVHFCFRVGGEKRDDTALLKHTHTEVKTKM